MTLGIRLQQKQSQSLVMTPQLAQSIKLLQLGSHELMDFVHEEIEKNPLLEIDPNSSLLGKDNRSEGGENELSNNNQHDSTKDVGDLVSGEMRLDAAESQASLDASFENVYDTGEVGPTPTQDKVKEKQASVSEKPSGINNAEPLDLAAMTGEKVTLSQYLKEQIGLSFKDKIERKVATYIAHGLDDDGYFRENTSEAAATNNVENDVFENVLKKFQTLEPTGIGARNLSECLKLQLLEKNRFDPAMEAMLDNLDLLAKADFPKLLKLCGVSKEDFSEMIAEIKALDPRPAAQYDAVLAETIIADVIIQQKHDGNWSIELNPETLPKVLVNQEYYTELETAIDTEDGKAFVADCMANASWLTKSLDQRAQTILKVATEIVRQQDMFFADGVEHLKPMNLKTVAQAIKMHESTVSRVTSNKYLRCNQGIFELKYFFSSSINSANEDEEQLSSETVKYKIKKLVDDENPKKILSDDQIVHMLQETGIAIARRTVAKYRDALRIPSSVQRRRIKHQNLGS